MLGAEDLKRQFMNVSEQFMLYDTVGIYTPPLGSNIANPDGWFFNYAALGAANDINFFDVRNRSAGLMWNNQDKRDQLAWPFEIHTIGVTFFADLMSGGANWATDQTFSPEDYASHLFLVDLPRHAGLTLQVQQDVRLRTHCYFAQPGYGPCGGGYGRGQPSGWTALDNDNGWDHYLSTATQGVPMYDVRWPFPEPLMVPRNATLRVIIRFTEYARALLAQLPFLGTFHGDVEGQTDIEEKAAFAGIQVSLTGKRLVQQRSEYHR